MGHQDQMFHQQPMAHELMMHQEPMAGQQPMAHELMMHHEPVAGHVHEPMRQPNMWAPDPETMASHQQMPMQQPVAGQPIANSAYPAHSAASAMAQSEIDLDFERHGLARP